MEGNPNVGVVFLDIDGVLNCRSDFLDPEIANTPWVVSEHRIEVLNTLLEDVAHHFDGGVRVVLSSAWRKAPGREFTERLLLDKGAKFNLSDTTGVEDTHRGLQILEWLQKNGSDVKAFVILDDNAGMWPLQRNLVQTNWATGLTSWDARMASQVLGDLC